MRSIRSALALPAPMVAAAAAVAFPRGSCLYLTLPDVRILATTNSHINRVHADERM